MSTAILHHPSSFRDPDSWVAEIEGPIVTRRYSPKGAADLAAFSETKAWKRLIDEGLIEAPTEMWLEGNSPYSTERRRTNWTYPYEWSQTMLQKAAIDHLRVTQIAGLSGWTTKDASSFNLVYSGGSFQFVDLGSFVRKEPGDPWWPYQEFCEHFLFPLMAGAYLGISQGKFTRSNLGKVPLGDAANLLKRHANKPGVVQHVLVPARVARSDTNVADGRKISRDLPGDPHDATLSSLRKVVNKVSSRGAHSVWGGYGNRSHYDPLSLQNKQKVVDSVVDRVKPKSVLDVGGNDGAFSSSFDNIESVVVADFSEDVIDALFRSKPSQNVTPVVLDVCNPTPAMGWANRERTAFLDRIRPDLMLMLAVVHHIVISGTVPFRQIATWCADSGADVLVEFVKPEDEKVQHLLARKVEKFPYSERLFLDAFEHAGFEIESLGEVSATRSMWLFTSEKSSNKKI